MKNMLLLVLLLGGLSMSASACAGTSPGIGFGGQMNLQGMTDGLKDAAIQQAQDVANKTKADIERKLKAEMQAQLDKIFKSIDEELARKIKELKG